MPRKVSVRILHINKYPFSSICIHAFPIHAPHTRDSPRILALPYSQLNPFYRFEKKRTSRATLQDISLLTLCLEQQLLKERGGALFSNEIID